MPACDKQLAEAVRRVVKTKKIFSVAVVSSNGDERSDAALVEEFGAGANVSVHKGAESIKSLGGLDCLIVNQAIEKVIKESLDDFVQSTLKALNYGGVAIIRQNLVPLNDSKKVAKLTDYLDVYRTEIDGKNTGFAFYAVEQIENSIHAHQNWHDYFWTLIKREFPVSKGDIVTFRDFLDKTQYTDTGIHSYEWIFGDNFISPGGFRQNLSIIKRFGDMKAGQTMLDIGVGIGGGARQVAAEFGVHVTGIDLSSNMLAVALDRVQKEKDSRVKYTICDVLVYDFVPNSFDYVFSRDCIQHIENTEKLFQTIYNALKPGGTVLITMYGVGSGELKEKFQAYVDQRKYYLRNLKQIQQFAEKVGFIDIYTENMTPRFKEILGEERSRVEDNKHEFLSKFSQKEYDSLVCGWNDKLQFISDDNHNWNLFRAKKPF